MEAHTEFLPVGLVLSREKHREAERKELATKKENIGIPRVNLIFRVLKCVLDVEPGCTCV